MHRCTISHIDPDSPLRHAAHPGDRLVSINGNPITDVLDYKYYAYDPELAVCLRRPDGTEHTVHVSKPLGGELGLDFETYLMDNAHSCANHCVFCFIDQMPPGTLQVAKAPSTIQGRRRAPELPHGQLYDAHEPVRA